MPVTASLLAHLEAVSRQNLQNHRLTAIAGGDINAAFRLQAAGVDWFIKLNRAELLDMFAAEATGLQELAALQQVRVPQVVTWGVHERQAYLILEYIELKPLSSQSARLLGQQLAQLHRQPQAYFGWCMDNTIGSTPQHNPAYQDWVSFWQQCRLGKQLAFAAAQGYTGSLQNQGERLLTKLPGFFSDYQPQPALLHGDLWGGNAACDHAGQPLIYDPACYYGDREADLAMTELFGGFGADFYAAYQADYPLDAGYQSRKTLYNLYHVLNHLNLFGSSYRTQAEHMIERLLAELS